MKYVIHIYYIVNFISRKQTNEKKKKKKKNKKKQNKATYVLDRLHYTTFDTRAYMRIYTAH